MQTVTRPCRDKKGRYRRHYFNNFQWGWKGCSNCGTWRRFNPWVLSS